MATIFPLFSAPVLYEEDTGFRVSEQTLNILTDLPLLDDPSISQKNLTQDTYVLRRPELVQAKELVERYLSDYLRDIASIEEDIYITNSWLTINKTGHGHIEHNHPHSLISGVLYLKADSDHPPLVFKGDTTIFNHYRFKFNTKQHNVFNSSTWSVNVKTGSLILFPSWITHYVPPNLNSNPRLCLGFNTFVRGTLPHIQTGNYSMDLKL